ncbi:hypothetical protein CSKR_110539 [Clonorchis sinensis]|uniref:Uncharacterized protein n=1 Tax=Clonorchis sinensis TaxID=79923 RepID=A0A419Q4W6_CLOSI|nr:hypothetical protein CSKR_110539 [Clonorchis sinensis]
MDPTKGGTTQVASRLCSGNASLWIQDVIRALHPKLGLAFKRHPEFVEIFMSGHRVTEYLRNRRMSLFCQKQEDVHRVTVDKLYPDESEKAGRLTTIEVVLWVHVTHSPAKYCGYDELRASHQTGYDSHGTVIATPYFGPWTAPYMNFLGNGPSGRKGTVKSREGLVAGVLSNWVWQYGTIIALTYFGF